MYSLVPTDSEVTVSGGTWQSEVFWSLACEGLAEPITGGAPYSDTHEMPPGECTLEMFDTYGDGWNGNALSLTDCAGTPLTPEATYTLDDADGADGSTGIHDVCIASDALDGGFAEGIATVEFVSSVFESHRLHGANVAIPLKTMTNPLLLLN